MVECQTSPTMTQDSTSTNVFPTYWVLFAYIETSLSLVTLMQKYGILFAKTIV